jgi:phosphoserine phosphatase
VSKILVVFDVDSTLIEDEVIELLADAAGSRPLVREITERAMSGELDFTSSLIERVATLKGLPEYTIHAVTKAINPTPGVQELINRIHVAGGLVGAVSGGFSQLLDPLADSLKLDFKHANELEIIGGVLTGRVVGQIVDSGVKRACLEQWADECGVPLNKTVAVGDGANDLEMMRVAGLSVAFNAKPIVRQNAQLVAGQRDLSTLIPLLGL